MIASIKLIQISKIYYAKTEVIALYILSKYFKGEELDKLLLPI